MSSLCLAQMSGGPSVVISRHPYANTTTDALGLEFVALECQHVPQITWDRFVRSNRSEVLMVRCLSEFLPSLIRHPLCRQTDLFISVQRLQRGWPSAIEHHVSWAG
jgi:hypothetical protein